MDLTDFSNFKRAVAQQFLSWRFDPQNLIQTEPRFRQYAMLLVEYAESKLNSRRS